MARCTVTRRATWGCVVLLASSVGVGCSSGDDSASPEAGPSSDTGPKEDATTPSDDATVHGDASADDASSPDAIALKDSGQDTGPPAVRLIGRFDLSTPGTPTAEWSGSAMHARFTGSSVSAKVGGGKNYFEIVLDGVVKSPLLTDGGSTYLLATNLEAGTHEALVFRRDEAFDQPTQFIGFDFGAGGQLLSPQATPNHRIEVIGDSISAGFGNECANASDGFTAATENEYLAYGPLTARALGADVHVVAWSGKGLYRNLDGSLTETMPILWKRTIATDANSVWDPSRYVADAVVINLGTNDFNASGADPSASYQSTYLDFVTHLRAVYPSAFIFCAVGPMLGGAHYTAVKTAITNVIAMRSAAGDARLQLVEFPTQDCGSDGSKCGCAGHPNLAEHDAMATILRGAMHSALGW